MATQSLFEAVAQCLAVCEPSAKVRCTHDIAEQFRNGQLSLVGARPPAPDTPGRPGRPRLVPPRQLPKRGLKDAEGRAALVHAVAHIEFNAINLALDAVLRFPDMPPDFAADWLRVADEEAYHFRLMRERLGALGHDYGDFPAHDGLWQMARQTAADPLRRMALVPRVLEARGLDVTPGMIERLRAVGDDDTADRLAIILREEVGHVAIGSRWFRWLCAERGLAPRDTYLGLIREHFRGAVRCPLNLPDRRRAGFDQAELDGLMAMCSGRLEG
ncbi:ferritin-like domain-containing protein [Thiohalocapsa marina]|uniref:Ferritin-like domain-containing protein n=1 Tax=Thiohalocapsa marina TaxID=424902 RepID=A0A5M8FS72_9GAMM|nr:ferritin-like domain-containing protein [Thiohalocapsa marina]KAA6184692.1 ferritin-like domain-containing protein [Thiohalocapsa marina]